MIYTVIVRGEEFQLTHNQISFDLPNYFLDCFTSGFAEARERVLRLDRNPSLFALIVEYLSGYPILPLASDSLPPGMGVTMAHRCLLADAQYFRLQRPRSQLTTPTLRTPLTWAGFANEVVNLRDVLASNLPDGVVQREDGSVMSTRTGHPVFIFAQDFLCSIVVHKVITDRAPHYDFDTTSHPRTLSLNISSPRHLLHPGPSSQPTEMPSASDAHHSNHLVTLTGLAKNAVLFINDSPHHLQDVSGWCQNHGTERKLSIAQESINTDLRRKAVRSVIDNPRKIKGIRALDRKVLYTYWADMVLCTFPPPKANKERKNVLVRAKLRSACRVLDEL